MRSSFIFTLGCALLWSMGLFAQYAVVRPSERVQLQRSTLDNANIITGLFQPSAARSVADLDLNSPYQLLEADAEIMELMRSGKQQALRLQLPDANGRPLTLELVEVSITTSDFTVVESATDEPVAVNAGAHYQGVIAGEEGSVVALSFWDGEMSGLISSPSRGNLSLGKLPDNAGRNNSANTYIIYNDQELLSRERFNCGTVDDGIGYTIEELREPAGRGPGDCVRVYFEVDYDIFQDKGGVNGAVNYVTALFNQVALLYNNEDVKVLISEIYVWSTSSPYAGTSSGTLLTQFQSVRTSFNGNIGQLLSYKASGGVAVLSGLCHPYTAARLSFASIDPTFNNVPSYSFSVMVVAHELGHLLGSQHTHACVWNGNNTAIDGCAGFVEGNCGNPGLPAGGGTIMSYCHISQAGINFSLGFGPQPGTVIRNRINAATCLQGCTTTGGGGGGTGGGSQPTCSTNKVFLRLVLDNYGPETTWELRNAQDQIIEQGGPYPKAQAGTAVLDTFCLPNGCYRFKILDSYADGICCQYGNGSYLLRDANNNTLASGGSFPASEQTQFCVPYQTGGNNPGCTTINFNTQTVQTYGVNQDGGTHQVQDNGATLFIQNNAWKALPLNYTVTPNTVIRFDFRSTVQGEVHGIGFDDNDNISYEYTFKVHGTQTWGLLNYDNYPNNGAWVTYTIPVGQFYTGAASRLFFCADNDSGQRTGNGWYRNVKIYEGANCDQLEPGSETQLTAPVEAPGATVFPNPATGETRLRVDSPAAGEAQWELVHLTGQALQTQRVQIPEAANTFEQRINLNGVAPGVYLLRWRDTNGEKTTRFTVN